MQTNPHIIKEVRDIYHWLDNELAGLDRSCRACGQCCDFETFGHRLYVTTPELLYFAASLTKRGLTPLISEMPDGVCPYRIDGKCSVYPYRFAGCRIFTCGGDAERENQCCEAALRRFKALCRGDDGAYRYLPLAAGLAWLRNGPAAPDHP